MKKQMLMMSIMVGILIGTGGCTDYSAQWAAELHQYKIEQAAAAATYKYCTQEEKEHLLYKYASFNTMSAEDQIAAGIIDPNNINTSSRWREIRSERLLSESRRRLNRLSRELRRYR